MEMKFDLLMKRFYIHIQILLALFAFCIQDKWCCDECVKILINSAVMSISKPLNVG